MRGEVVEKLERLKDVSEPIYHEVVDAVAAKYARQEGVAKTEVKALAQELKETWRSIVSDARKKPVRRVRRKAKRALAKKTVPRKRRA
jgi:hypothetical protein